MKRINFYVDEDRLEELRKLSEEQKVPYAEKIREYIEDGLWKDKHSDK